MMAASVWAFDFDGVIVDSARETGANVRTNELILTRRHRRT
jgi:hypothetical protein